MASMKHVALLWHLSGDCFYDHKCIVKTGIDNNQAEGKGDNLNQGGPL